MRADVIVLQRKLAARDAVIWSVVESSCATLKPALQRLVESFHAGNSKVMGRSFRAGYFFSQLPADTAPDGTILRFPGPAASEDGGGSTKSGSVVEPQLHSEFIEV